MTEKTYQVGDVVAWDKVPSGALVRATPAGCYFMRRGSKGHLIAFADQSMWESWAEMGDDEAPWWFDCGLSNGAEAVTIIALDVPADATAEDLRTLAEVFEVRKAIEAQRDDSWCWSETVRRDSLDWLVDRLHRAGWRPGMTAEDAARMLAKQETACRR